MKWMIRLLLCLLAAPLFARSSYPPTFKDARVETYRTIGSTELKLWIFGESDPKAKKPAMVFFFGGGWHGENRGQESILDRSSTPRCVEEKWSGGNY